MYLDVQCLSLSTDQCGTANQLYTNRVMEGEGHVRVGWAAKKKTEGNDEFVQTRVSTQRTFKLPARTDDRCASWFEEILALFPETCAGMLSKNGSFSSILLCVGWCLTPMHPVRTFAHPIAIAE